MKNIKKKRASTELITYLNYLSTWETESEENIDILINEHNLFLMLGDFDSDHIVDKEFDYIYHLASNMKLETTADDGIRITADAAAIASIWSLGLSMAVFANLEASRVILEGVISKHAKELNERLKNADNNISHEIGSNVHDYITHYKKNNTLIAAKAPAGLDARICRSHLFQFMGAIERKEKKLDARIFRLYAESARLLFHSDEINKVYNALDELNFSKKTDDDVKRCIDIIKNINIPPDAIYAFNIILPLSFSIMIYKLKISMNTIKKQSEEVGIPAEEVSPCSFEVMDAIGRFATVITITLNMVDIFLAILDIVAVIQQCKELCDKINGVIRVNYKAYYNGIKLASNEYKKAIKNYRESIITD